MKIRPESDLTDNFQEDIALRLQNQSLFDELHAISEARNLFYKAAHTTIAITAKPSLDNDLLERAVLTGVQAFEIIDSLNRGEDAYTDPAEKIAVIKDVKDFLSDIHNDDDFLRKLDFAGKKLRDDTPRLDELITEVSGRYVEHDSIAIDFARQGAGAIRAMQIYTQRHLAV